MRRRILLLVLVLFFVLVFISSGLADLYIVKDQEGKIIAITNQNIFKARYQELGYIFELWLKQTKSTPTLDSLIKDWGSQIKEPEVKIGRGRMIEIFKTEALAKWGDDYRMVSYEMEGQTEAYDWVVKRTKYPEIMTKAKQKWGNDYKMVKYEYKRQVEAYESL